MPYGPVYISTLALVLTSTHAHGPPVDDKGWDRQRSCGASMSPPCQACEGIGGIPSGDANDDIILTTCEVVTLSSDDALPVQPIWGTAFSYIDGINEVLIGKKQDPACFQTFPGADASGPLCYRKQSGSKYYDMENTMAFQQELQLSLLPLLPPVKSTVTHHETNMWIDNNLWLAVSQCICVGFTSLYPVNPNWLEGVVFLGREIIGVEFLDTEMELNHFMKGPHHLWSDTVTGIIVRMYQPWNGLQVYDPATRVPEVAKTITFPPEACKAGGATFRTGCDDDGYPIKRIWP